MGNTTALLGSCPFLLCPRRVSAQLRTTCCQRRTGPEHPQMTPIPQMKARIRDRVHLRIFGRVFPLPQSGISLEAGPATSLVPFPYLPAAEGAHA